MSAKHQRMSSISGSAGVNLGQESAMLAHHQQPQHAAAPTNKAIKKKSLLNFRAIKNNYVVQKQGSNSSTNANAAQQQQLLQNEPSPTKGNGNSSIAQQQAAVVSNSNNNVGGNNSRRNTHHNQVNKIRASHSSQFGASHHDPHPTTTTTTVSQQDHHLAQSYLSGGTGGPKATSQTRNAVNQKSGNQGHHSMHNANHMTSYNTNTKNGNGGQSSQDMIQRYQQQQQPSMIMQQMQNQQPNSARQKLNQPQPQQYLHANAPSHIESEALLFQQAKNSNQGYNSSISNLNQQRAAGGGSSTQRLPSQSNSNSNSQSNNRVHVLNHRLKSRGAPIGGANNGPSASLRRIQLQNQQQQAVHATNSNHNNQGTAVAQGGGHGQSLERFQNNNVSSQNPGKALVSPRGGLPSTGVNNLPHGLYNLNPLQSSHQKSSGQKAGGGPSGSHYQLQGVQSTKNTTSQPLIFANQGNMSARNSLHPPPNQAFPRLSGGGGQSGAGGTNSNHILQSTHSNTHVPPHQHHQIQESPRQLQKALLPLAGQSSHAEIGGIGTRSNWHQQPGGNSGLNSGGPANKQGTNSTKVLQRGLNGNGAAQSNPPAAKSTTIDHLLPSGYHLHHHQQRGVNQLQQQQVVISERTKTKFLKRSQERKGGVQQIYGGQPSVHLSYQANAGLKVENGTNQYSHQQPHHPQQMQKHKMQTTHGGGSGGQAAFHHHTKNSHSSHTISHPSGVLSANNRLSSTNNSYAVTKQPHPSNTINLSSYQSQTIAATSTANKTTASSNQISQNNYNLSTSNHHGFSSASHLNKASFKGQSSHGGQGGSKASSLQPQLYQTGLLNNGGGSSSHKSTSERDNHNVSSRKAVGVNSVGVAAHQQNSHSLRRKLKQQHQNVVQQQNQLLVNTSNSQNSLRGGVFNQQPQKYANNVVAGNGAGHKHNLTMDSNPPHPHPHQPATAVNQQYMNNNNDPPGYQNEQQVVQNSSSSITTSKTSKTHKTINLNNLSSRRQEAAAQPAQAQAQAKNQHPLSNQGTFHHSIVNSSSSPVSSSQQQDHHLQQQNSRIITQKEQDQEEGVGGSVGGSQSSRSTNHFNNQKNSNKQGGGGVGGGSGRNRRATEQSSTSDGGVLQQMDNMSTPTSSGKDRKPPLEQQSKPQSADGQQTPQHQDTSSKSNKGKEGVAPKIVEPKVESSIDKFSFPLDGNQIKSMPSAKNYLNFHEITEVAEFDEVWYLAHNTQKYQPTKLERLVNNGFDDSEGYYRIVSGDQVNYRFQMIEMIGKGAFGQVIKCDDHKTGRQVAIKMVKNQKRYYYQAAVEAKLLLVLKENDPQGDERVVKLLDYFVWRNHLCIVFELYSINLYEFIKMYDYQGFDYGLIRRFAIQLLCGLRYLKQLGIIHCDLKPENILMKQKDKSGIAIADFGSGCLENEIVYTYIQSRFYRAPDIMLGLFPYTQQIDMWSFGCILIELFTGFPLFPGTNEREQIQLIIDVIGMPNASVLSRASRKHLFKQFSTENNAVPAPLEVISDHEKDKRLRYIMEKLREIPDPQFVDLISRCLEWDPKRRLTPDEGLNHEWILKGLPKGILDQQRHHQAQQQQKQGHQQIQSSSPRKSDRRGGARHSQRQASSSNTKQYHHHQNNSGGVSASRILTPQKKQSSHKGQQYSKNKQQIQQNSEFNSVETSQNQSPVKASHQHNGATNSSSTRGLNQPRTAR